MEKSFFKILLLLLLTGGFFLRITRLQELFVFGFDEEVIAFRSKQLIANLKPFLIGGVTPFHVHLGPLFYYFSSLLLVWPWKLNPLSWGVWAAVIATLVIFLLFGVGKKLFNERVGLLAAFFQAFSFYQILYDRHYWPLFLDPLFSLITLLSLYQIIKGKLNWVFVLSLTLAFAWQTDPTTWPLFIFVVVIWWLFSLPIRNKKVALACLIFLFSFFPLVIFDIRHQGANIKGLWQFKSVTQKTLGFSGERLRNTLVYLPQGLAKLLWVSGKEKIYYHQFRINELTGWQAVLIILILFFVAKIGFRRKTKDPGLKLLSLFFAITFMGVFFYGNFIGFDLWEHYLVILFPIFFLDLAVLFDVLWQSHGYPLVPLFLIVFIFVNIREFFLFKPRFNFKNKMAAVSWVKQEIQEEKFTLESLSRDFRYNGIRYLFYLVGKEPEMSFVDPALFWLYDEKPADKYPKNFVVFVSRDFEDDSKEGQLYQQFSEESRAKKTFQDLEVLIVDNEKQQFTVDY